MPRETIQTGSHMTNTQYVSLVVLAIVFLTAIVAAGALVSTAVAIIVALFGLFIIPGIADKVGGDK